MLIAMRAWWAVMAVFWVGVPALAQDEPNTPENAPEQAEDGADPSDQDASDPAEVSEADAPAEQEEVPEEARIRFELGNTLYDQGRFAEALEQFAGAFESTGRPELLHNMYLCERDAGNEREAADYLERYLELGADEVPNRPLLESRLQALRQEIAEQEAAAERAAESEALILQQQRQQQAEPPLRLGPIVLFSAGGAALLAAGGLTAAVASLNGQLKDDCFGDLCFPESDDDRAALRRRAISVDALLATGGALVLGGILWWVISNKSNQPEGAESALQMDCGPSGCSVQGAF